MVDYPNIFALGQQAFDTSYKRANTMREDRANVYAGKALAKGDYQGAQQAFGEGGMPEQVAQTLNVQQQQQGRQAKINAATAYGDGDTQGAIQALGQTGDIAGQSAIQSEAIAKHTAQMTFAQQEAAKLRQIYAQAKAANTPDGGLAALKTAYDAQAPQYKAMGSSDQEIAQLWQQISQNPDAVLNAIATPRKIEYKQVGDSLYPIDADSGQPLGKPIVGSKVMAMGPDQTIVRVGGDGESGPPHTGGGQPQGAGGDTRGIRNNNPLNLTTLPNGQWDGQTGTDGRFAVFSSPEAGMAAADKNLLGYGKNHGINTVQGIVNRWAPKGDGANDPVAYAATVSKDIGVAPDQPIDLANPQTRAMILHSMSKVELGGSGSGIQRAGAQPAQGGPQVLAQGPMAQSAATVNAGAAAGLTGDAFLQTLPPAMQQTVKAVAEGRMALPGGFVLKTPYGQQLIAAVGQYDPTFSAANAQTRAATRKDFTSGKSAQTLTAFNTALAHLSNLDQAISGLNNNGLPLNNAAAHWIAGVTGTDSRLAKFEYVKRTALDEVNKALVGAGGALGDREALMKQMNAASNPETLHAAVAEIADLLQGKINAMGNQYTQGMGTDAYPIQLITPQAQATISRLSAGGKGGAAAPAGGIHFTYDAQGNRVSGH